VLKLRITIRAHGPVPAGTAWERYDRLDLWSTWSPQVSRVSVDGSDHRSQSHDRLSAGLTGRVHAPLGIWVGFTVLTLDRDAMRWSWQVRRGLLSVHLDHQVTSRPDGSATDLTVTGPAPLVLAYLPAAQFALHRLVGAVD